MKTIIQILVYFKIMSYNIFKNKKKDLRLLNIPQIYLITTR